MRRGSRRGALRSPCPRRRHHHHGTPGGQHEPQVGGRRRRLEERVGQRDERSIDQPADGRGGERDRDGGEPEWEQASAPAGNDEQGDAPHVAAADRAGDQRRQRADTKGRPLGAEQPRRRLHVNGDAAGILGPQGPRELPALGTSVSCGSGGSGSCFRQDLGRHSPGRRTGPSAPGPPPHRSPGPARRLRRGRLS